VDSNQLHRRAAAGRLQLQHLVEVRHGLAGEALGEPPARVEAEELAQAMLGHRARAVGRALQARVRDHHGVSPLAGVHVEAETIGARVERAPEARQGVLRRLERRAALAEDPGRAFESNLSFGDAQQAPELFAHGAASSAPRR
jgi:hypothetical protein